MTIISSTSASPSTPGVFWAPVYIFMPANHPVTIGLVLFPYAGLPVIRDMTKPFFMGKPVTAVNNTLAQKYTKGII